jgi:Chaperone of endosialidase
MLFDYVLENVTAPGTGTTVSLAGAVSGRKSYSQATTTGSAVFYTLDDGSQAEWGYGVYTTSTPNTVTRGTVIGNTAGTTARLNFSGTTRIFNSLPASRAVWLDANLAKTSGMIVNGVDGGSFQYRAVSGSYGAGIYNDGSGVYLLSTASGSQYSTANALRPFAWNLSTGAVTIDATAVGTTFGGNITSTAGGVILKNNAAYYGKDTGGTNRPLLMCDTSNNTTMWVAGSGATWRVVNVAGTTSLLTLDNSGNFSAAANVHGASATFTGNVQAGTTSGGYLCKAGATGGYGTNNFNFFWTGSAVQSYIDSTLIGSVQMVSDERFKREIDPLTDGALSRILCLRPVHFRWRDRGIFEDDGKRHDGLIAQEVRRHIPDAVSIGGADDTMTLNPLPLIAHLVKAVQELAAEVAALKRIIHD